jgi:L-threonylcarbamoyladenylate synthase
MDHPSEIERAVATLRAGGLVAFPTETVYGLGADAENAVAVRRLYEAKGRPPGHPLIVHLADAEQLPDWASEVPPRARLLAERFWPGPLTLVLRKAERVPDVVTGGLPTVGLRVPAHHRALDLLRAFGSGIAAPSANRFGAVSPTTAEHVREAFGSLVDVVLDGGPCRVGVESTIVDLSGETPGLLRPGGVPREALEDALGEPLPLRDGGEVRAPGQLPSHYAPTARVLLVPSNEQAKCARDLVERGQRVGVLAFPGHGESEIAGAAEAVVRLDGPEDVVARRLYQALRDLDRLGCDVILTALPDERGLGLAISDRLRRAAGPRSRRG